MFKNFTLSNLYLAGLLSLSLLLTVGLAACGDATAPTGNAASNTAAISATTGTAVTTSAAMTTSAAVLSTGDEKPDAAHPFRIGLIPNQNPDTVKTQYAAFKTYMEKELGVPIELYVGSDYPAVVQAMVSEKLDMAYFGGLTYLQCKQQADIYPIVTEIDKTSHDRTYTSAIIVPTDSPVQKVEDLKGKTFAFGDPSSTSGSLYPRIMLDAAGIKVPQDLKDVKYTGGHDATAAAVANGSVDAGGLEERILLYLEDSGKIDKNKVRIIKRSDPIMGYPWAVRSKLAKDFVAKVTNTFLNIKDPELLKLRRIDGYATVIDADYQPAREQALRLGLLTARK